MTRENYKFLSNKGVDVEFEYDQGREKIWDDGNKTYSYGVKIRGVEYYLSASEALEERIRKFAPLKGKVLNITKATEIGTNGREKSKWLVEDGSFFREAGVEADKVLETHKADIPITKRDMKLLMAGCIKTVAEAFKANGLENHAQVGQVINTLFMEEAKR